MHPAPSVILTLGDESFGSGWGEAPGEGEGGWGVGGCCTIPSPDELIPGVGELEGDRQAVQLGFGFCQVPLVGEPTRAWQLIHLPTSPAMRLNNKNDADCSHNNENEIEHENENED